MYPDQTIWDVAQTDSSWAWCHRGRKREKTSKVITLPKNTSRFAHRPSCCCKTRLGKVIDAEEEHKSKKDQLVSCVHATRHFKHFLSVKYRNAMNMLVNFTGSKLVSVRKCLNSDILLLRRPHTNQTEQQRKSQRIESVLFLLFLLSRETVPRQRLSCRKQRGLWVSKNVFCVCALLRSLSTNSNHFSSKSRLCLLTGGQWKKKEIKKYEHCGNLFMGFLAFGRSTP